MAKRSLVCIAPLNWGLGHAGRCIPIIHEYINHGCEVVLCGNGESLDFLKREFPQLPIEHLPDFQMHYAPTAWLTQFSIMAQVPAFLRSIRLDMHATQLIVKKYKPELLISDNRYGFWHPEVYSILITHQIRPILPGCYRFLSYPFYSIIDTWMNKFNEIWIPDVSGEPNLSGKLSHVPVFEEKKRFIGILSRFQRTEKQHAHETYIVAIASGPEPARTQFIKYVSSIARKNMFPVTLLAPPSVKIETYHRKVFAKIIQTTSTSVVQQVLSEAMCVFSRSAYTTLMDLVRLSKKAILVPTPGQTEQLYLAKHNQQYFLFEKLEKSEQFNETVQTLMLKEQGNEFIRNDDVMLKEALQYTFLKF